MCNSYKEKHIVKIGVKSEIPHRCISFKPTSKKRMFSFSKKGEIPNSPELLICQIVSMHNNIKIEVLQRTTTTYSFEKRSLKVYPSLKIIK